MADHFEKKFLYKKCQGHLYFKVKVSVSYVTENGLFWRTFMYVNNEHNWLIDSKLYDQDKKKVELS